MLKGLPFLASAAAHVGLAAALISGAGGQGTAPSGAPPTEIAIDLASPPEAPTAPAQEPSPRAVEHHRAPVATPAAAAATAEPTAAHVAAPTAAAESTSPELPRFDLRTDGAAPGGVVRVAGPAADAPASPGAIVPESVVTVRASLVARAPAVYPAAARASALEADVPVEIVVDESGAVTDARVVAPASVFDASALAAIRGYHFSPASRDGRPVRVRMRWSIAFRLL